MTPQIDLIILFLGAATVVFLLGFTFGYAVRSRISRKRRQRYDWAS